MGVPVAKWPTSIPAPGQPVSSRRAAEVARDRGDADPLPVATSTRAWIVTGTGCLRGTNSARNTRRAVGAFVDDLQDRVEVVGAKDQLGRVRSSSRR